VIYEGFYGDSSKMFCIGEVLPFAKRLVDVTQQCLYAGISVVKPGCTLCDIGHAIQSLAVKSGYSIVREYCGHGIGEKMHEDPQVVHYGRPGVGEVLKAGMIFTIEPMINQGAAKLKHLEKEFTIGDPPKKGKWPIAITNDKKLSAQWEHTLLVTPEGVDVLTLREEERDVFEYITLDS